MSGHVPPYGSYRSSAAVGLGTSLRAATHAAAVRIDSTPLLAAVLLLEPLLLLPLLPEGAADARALLVLLVRTGPVPACSCGCGLAGAAAPVEAASARALRTVMAKT